MALTSFSVIQMLYGHRVTCSFSPYIIGEDVPPMQLKESVFRCIMQLYDCLLTEVHERCKKGLSLAKRLNSSLAFFCYDLLYIIEPCQVYELVCFCFVSFTLSYMAATVALVKFASEFSLEVS